MVQQMDNAPCFGHNLHLVITNTLKNNPRVQRALGVSVKIMAAFKTSWKRRKNLGAAQAQPMHLLMHNKSTVAQTMSDVRHYV